MNRACSETRLLPRVVLSVFLLLRRAGLRPPERLRRRMTFSGRFEVSESPVGPLILFNDRHYLEGEFFWRGYYRFEWERRSRDVWCILAARSSVILDIGANTGIYSLLAAAANPAASIMAFEPQPNVFESLVKNAKAAGADISCQQVALSDVEGRLPFYNYGHSPFTSNSTAGSLNQGWRTEDQKCILVDVVRLDEVVVGNGLGVVDLIKIDVESFEPEVLRGAERVLMSSRPIILLEVASREIGDRVVAALPADVYRFFRIDERYGLVSVEALGSDHSHSNILLVQESRIEGLDVLHFASRR
jgi:FkbM family methyltransferase